MRRNSPNNWLLAGLAVLALVATAWLLWPWQGGSAPAPSFLPTLTATLARPTVQRLPTSTPFLPTPTPEPVIHIVQPNDVLGIIARQYGVTEKAIMEANGLKSDLIIDGQELVIPSPQRTMVPLVTRTPTVTPTPTSVYRYPVPGLLGPADGATFQGADARVVLNWASVGILGEGEWYEVRVWSDKLGESDAQRFYTQASSLSLPASLRPTEGNGLLHWSVAVVYRGRRTSALSPTNVARGLTWR